MSPPGLGRHGKNTGSGKGKHGRNEVMEQQVVMISRPSNPKSKSVKRERPRSVPSAVGGSSRSSSQTQSRRFISELTTQPLPYQGPRTSEGPSAFDGKLHPTGSVNLKHSPPHSSPVPSRAEPKHNPTRTTVTTGTSGSEEALLADTDLPKAQDSSPPSF